MNLNELKDTEKEDLKWKFVMHPIRSNREASIQGRLREEYLIEALFQADALTLYYSHADRFVVGGAVPVYQPVKLEADKHTIGADSFLERREVGIINIGGKGTVTVDGLDSKDCLYVGLGSKDVVMASDDALQPAKFYLNSTPAHHAYKVEKAAPVHLGSPANSNERTIYKYIHTGGIQSRRRLVMSSYRTSKLSFLQAGRFTAV